MSTKHTFKNTMNIEAIVEWKPGTQHLFSGIRPSISIADALIACEVFHNVADDLLERGRQYEVRIVIPDGKLFRDHIVPGMTFNLHAGARILGGGSVLRVVE